MSMKMLQVYHRHRPKLKHHQTQENAANDSLATQGTNYKAVKEFSKQPNACVVAKSGHLYYSK